MLPGHHGYQRACDLINVQASTGPTGPPVFACAGKTDPPSRSLAELGGWRVRFCTAIGEKWRLASKVALFRFISARPNGVKAQFGILEQGL